MMNMQDTNTTTVTTQGKTLTFETHANGGGTLWDGPCCLSDFGPNGLFNLVVDWCADNGLCEDQAFGDLGWGD